MGVTVFGDFELGELVDYRIENASESSICRRIVQIDERAPLSIFVDDRLIPRCWEIVNRSEIEI